MSLFSALCDREYGSSGRWWSDLNSWSSFIRLHAFVCTIQVRSITNLFQRVDEEICIEKTAKSSPLSDGKKSVKKNQKVLKQLKASAQGKLNASQHINDANPFVRLEAQKAAKALDSVPMTSTKEEKSNSDRVGNCPVTAEEIEIIKKQKRVIYFSNVKEAEKWFEMHPQPQDFKKYKRSPRAQLSASQFVEAENPRIQLTAIKAQKILDKYSKSIRSVLSGYAKTRTDLLEHVIGPKNFLFSDYGLLLANKSRGGYPFCFVPSAMNSCEYKRGLQKGLHLRGCLGYAFENLSPKALEEEIRSDLKPHLPTYFPVPGVLTEEELRPGYHSPSPTDLSFPGPFIQEEIVTYPVSEELFALQGKLRDKLDMWKILSTEEQQSALQLLLEFNKWDEYKIEPKNIRLVKCVSHDSYDTWDGELTGGIWDPPEVVFISFNTHSFLLIIDERPNCDTISTYKFLGDNYNDIIC